MANRIPAVALATALPFAVWLHATEAHRFCLTHPISWSCDNPIVPVPEFAHEQPSEPTTPTMVSVHPTAAANNSGGNAVHLHAMPLVAGRPQFTAPDLIVMG